MKQYAFGVDIGGTTAKIGLFETKGKLIEVWEIPTRKEEKGRYILPDIADEIEKKMLEKGIFKSQVEGIGMGVPGPISPDGSVLKCVNLGWGVFSVEQEMTKLTGLKAKAGNDANVAALGEMWQGGGQGYKNIVMITLGTGVGGGIINDGHILPGMDGAAGEIGHIPMRDDEEESCGCGKKGCLEQYASANGIVRITKRYLKKHSEIDSVLRKKESYTSKEIFEEAKKGDKAALHMVDEVGKMLGKALAAISCVVNPEAFVIGGGMSKAGDILLEAIKKYYKKYAFHAARNTTFKFALLSNNAGIYGAVKLVLE
ncbi:MAG TPA: ROK family glucokinase [Candidatus Anaerostipes excrementavium]|uniref:Glucokinase n=1 Tax=Candidatus Anaerostipes excrementavium TaxID=2838463 RepID=A0A9D2BAT7_9FIRM|nr:ROK family glucokinase [uncultured Anaerostipes sp.]HIX68564.1 ROK family glucokinase [Candidatus Anaerostipes excrementavium]